MNSCTWRVVAASRPGSAHQAAGLPCQDAQACLRLPSGGLVAVVADGAGSAVQAQAGAQRAVEQAAAALAAALQASPPADEAGWEALMRQAFADARQALEQLSAQAGLPLRAFATTLACAAWLAGWLAVGQIGDGAVVVEALPPDGAMDREGDLLLAARPQRGEYANEAYFLTMPGALQHVSVYVSAQPLRALALTTDGLLRLGFKLPGCEPHPGFFRPLLAFVAQAQDEEQGNAELAAFLDAERVCARTDDDKTLVLAVCAACPSETVP